LTRKPIFTSSASATAHGLICLRDGLPIGFAVFFFSYSTWLGSNCLYLEDLYINPEQRGGGGEKAGGSGQRKAPARKAADRQASAKRAAATREGHPRSSRASLATQTKESLLKEARAKDIPGRSSMRKDQLIEALRKAG
jgi:hypothetical protein